MKRKIEAMYEEYGMIPNKYCKTCCNLFRGEYHGRTYSKCIAYGVSHSEATDWAIGNKACGLHNKTFNERAQKPFINVLKSVKEVDNEPMKGQMSL